MRTPKEIKKSLYRGGFTHLMEAEGLPSGVTLWVQRLGVWTEDPGLSEYFAFFVSEVEGQDLLYAISPYYFRAHNRKNVEKYLLKNGAKIFRGLDDVVSDSWETILKDERAVKRIDCSEDLRVR